MRTAQGLRVRVQYAEQCVCDTALLVRHFATQKDPLVWAVGRQGLVPVCECAWIKFMGLRWSVTGSCWRGAGGWCVLCSVRAEGSFMMNMCRRLQSEKQRTGGVLK